jgi:hypothetical protein
MKSILDRSFRYTPSHATDIRKTFERIRAERELFRSDGQSVLQMKREKKQGRAP